MEDFIQFVGQHWLLCGLLVMVLVLLLVEEIRSKGLLGQLSPQELVQMINRESAVVVDIRGREAFQEGHIIGAVNFPQTELEKDFNKLAKYKGRPIVIVCATGQKAGGIALQLQKQNFTQVRSLSGGITAWRAANMPLIRK